MSGQPLDILFALDQVASNPPQELEGMIDAEHAGATGYSFDCYNALALSGSRIDPAQYLAQGPNPDPTTGAILSSISAFDCGPAGAWDGFAAHTGQAITASEYWLWQALTDKRIRVVVPMTADGAQLYGERGLSVADRPMLILAPTEDEWVPNQLETVTIFEHASNPERFLVSCIGKTHMMVLEPEVAKRLEHFATAFLGYHLQGKSEHRDYFSEAFVSQTDDLAWGVHEGE
jgi:predicted dienelactone hydrolase